MPDADEEKIEDFFALDDLPPNVLYDVLLKLTIPDRVNASKAIPAMRHIIYEEPKFLGAFETLQLVAPQKPPQHPLPDASIYPPPSHLSLEPTASEVAFFSLTPDISVDDPLFPSFFIAHLEKHLLPILPLFRSILIDLSSSFPDPTFHQPNAFMLRTLLSFLAHHAPRNLVLLSFTFSFSVVAYEDYQGDGRGRRKWPLPKPLPSCCKEPLRRLQTHRNIRIGLRLRENVYMKPLLEYFAAESIDCIHFDSGGDPSVALDWAGDCKRVAKTCPNLRRLRIMIDPMLLELTPLPSSLTQLDLFFSWEYFFTPDLISSVFQRIRTLPHLSRLFISHLYEFDRLVDDLVEDWTRKSRPLFESVSSLCIRCGPERLRGMEPAPNPKEEFQKLKTIFPNVEEVEVLNM